ncbi:MAG: hypothetical protein ACM3X6_02915 [Patescibacteria group bacterium]
MAKKQGTDKAPPPAPRPWEQQPGESAKAFEAFARYRDMGAARSLAKVSQALSKSKVLLQRWSSAFSWVERVEAWDRHIARQEQEAQLKARLDMAARHAKAAMALMHKALQKLAKMKPEELEPGDVARFIDTAVKIERVACGEPADIIRTEDGGERTVTDDERNELARKILGNKRARRLLRDLYRSTRDAVES